MAFAAYLDESGLDDRSATFWMGGYVGQLPEWFEFSRHWRRMLKNAGIPFFRMSEFANPAGRYRGWSTEDKNALCAEATGIINSVDVWGLGAGVVKADYERVIVAGDFLERAGLRRGWWSHPFLLAFTECVLDVVKLARRLPAGKVVAFICDRQET